MTPNITSCDYHCINLLWAKLDSKVPSLIGDSVHDGSAGPSEPGAPAISEEQDGVRHGWCNLTPAIEKELEDIKDEDARHAWFKLACRKLRVAVRLVSETKTAAQLATELGQSDHALLAGGSDGLVLTLVAKRAHVPGTQMGGDPHLLIV